MRTFSLFESFVSLDTRWRQSKTGGGGFSNKPPETYIVVGILLSSACTGNNCQLAVSPTMATKTSSVMVVVVVFDWFESMELSAVEIAFTIWLILILEQLHLSPKENFKVHPHEVNYSTTSRPRVQWHSLAIIIWATFGFHSLLHYHHCLVSDGNSLHSG